MLPACMRRKSNYYNVIPRDVTCHDVNGIRPIVIQRGGSAVSGVAACRGSWRKQTLRYGYKPATGSAMAVAYLKLFGVSCYRSYRRHPRLAISG